MAMKMKVALAGLAAVVLLVAATLALEGDAQQEVGPEQAEPAAVLPTRPGPNANQHTRVEVTPGVKKPMRIRFVNLKQKGLEGLSFKLAADPRTKAKVVFVQQGITGRYGFFSFDTPLDPGMYRVHLDPDYEILDGIQWQVGGAGRRSHTVVCWDPSKGISGTLLDLKGHPIADVEMQARYEWSDEMIGRAVPLWRRPRFTWKEWVGDITFTDKDGMFRLMLPDARPVHLGSLGMSKKAKICATFHTSRSYPPGTHGIRLEARRSDVLNVRAYSDGRPSVPIEDYAVFWYFNGKPGGPYSAVGPFRDGLARVPMGKGDKRILVVPRDLALQIGEVASYKGTEGDLVVRLRASRSLLLKVRRSDGKPIEQGEIIVVDQERFPRNIKNDFFLNGATDYAEVWRSRRWTVTSEYTPWAILLTQARASSPRITGRFALDPQGDALLRYPDSSKMTMLIKCKGCAPAFFDLDIHAKVQQVVVQALVDQDIQIVPTDFPRLAKGDLWVRHEQMVSSSGLPMFERSVVLDSENSGRMEGLAPGRFRVNYKGEDLGRLFQIPSIGDRVLRIDLSHLRPARISGQASYSEGWPNGSTAFLFNEKHHGRIRQDSSSEVDLTAAGDFEFVDTLPGTYRIGFWRILTTGKKALLPCTAPFEVKPADRVVKIVTIKTAHLFLRIRSKTGQDLTGQRILIEGEPLYQRELVLGPKLDVDLPFGPTKRLRVTLFPKFSWKSIVAARNDPKLRSRLKPKISEWKVVPPTEGLIKLDFSF